jgi:NADPH-dependent curcumin reductase CurA
MSKVENVQVKLVARPDGLPKASDFAMERAPLRAAEAGEVVVEVSHVSLDPAMRGWMDDRPSYLPPVKLGETMRATGIGQVIASASPSFEVGEHVTGHLGVQHFAVVPAASLRRVDPSLAPLDVQIGLLSTAGLTAYFGLLDVGKPQRGNTVVISGAAGAVGSVAGQIARIHGCRVVGLAGGPEKKAYLTDELRFDVGIDYKRDDVPARLSESCPDGIDIYFDNVGNPLLDIALKRLAIGARVILCGAVSQYNNSGKVSGPEAYISLIVKRATMQGFIVFDFKQRYPEATRQLAHWWRAGDIHYRADIAEGLGSFHSALLRLFNGENQGKSLIRL